MALTAPKVPYAPLRYGTPRPVAPEPRKWLLVVAVLVVVGLVGSLVYALATIPMRQSTSVGFLISNPGGTTIVRSVNTTFPRSGVFDFSWWTNTTEFVNLTVVDSSGRTVYSGVGAVRDGNFTVVGGERYTFEVPVWWISSPAWVYVSGDLTYSAPLI